MKVQHQPPLAPGDDGVVPVEHQIAEAVRRIREEDFPARAGVHCRHCSFLRMCPHEPSGTVV